MRILVLGHGPYTTQLVAALMLEGAKRHAYEIVHQKMPDGILGKPTEIVCIDDCSMLGVNTLLGFNQIESPPLETDGRRRRSKGDKHRNRKYRWAE